MAKPVDIESVYARADGRLIESVWPAGRNSLRAPTDGHHYAPLGAARPVSLSRLERAILCRVAEWRGGPAIEIGTGFGISATALAAGLAISGRGAELISVDEYSEGPASDQLASIAHALVDAIEGVAVTFVRGSSPGVLPSVLKTRQRMRLCFIDGNHHASAPVEDYRGVRDFLAEDAVLFFHDFDLTRYTVHIAVAEALVDGHAAVVLPTSCSLAVCSRDLSILAAISDLAVEISEQLGR